MRADTDVPRVDFAVMTCVPGASDHRAPSNVWPSTVHATRADARTGGAQAESSRTSRRRRAVWCSDRRRAARACENVSTVSAAGVRDGSVHSSRQSSADVRPVARVIPPCAHSLYSPGARCVRRAPSRRRVSARCRGRTTRRLARRSSSPGARRGDTPARSTRRACDGVVSTPGANALRRRHHRAMQQRTGTGDAAHALHRMSAEVARPHRDGEAARRADRPVVGEVAARAGLHRDGKWKVERRLEAEAGHARGRIARGCRARSRSPPADATRCSVTAHSCAARHGSPRPRAPLAAVGQRAIAIRQLDERDVAVAEREAEAVVLGVARERREAGEPAASAEDSTRRAATRAPPPARCTSWPAPRARAPVRESGDRSCADGTRRSLVA